MTAKSRDLFEILPNFFDQGVVLTKRAIEYRPVHHQERQHEANRERESTCERILIF